MNDFSSHLSVTVALYVLNCVATSTVSLHRDMDGERIDFINRCHHDGKRGTWTARRNFRIGQTDEEKRALTGVLFRPTTLPNLPPSHPTRAVASLPATFDARLKWPNCTIISDVRNQLQCGSCWAHTGASVISDRLCIASPGQKTNFKASVQDILTCNNKVPWNITSSCFGGYLDTPFAMWTTTGQYSGVVSGGEYGSSIGCKPYTAMDAACSLSCSNSDYGNSYANDKTHGFRAYNLGLPYPSTKETPTSAAIIDAIRNDIMTNGPLAVAFDVYADFYLYGLGIYKHTTGSSMGGHGLTVIGWGTDGGVDYWLMKNSWGPNWGSLGGFVKFLRGINHLGIETALAAALPLAPAATPPTTAKTSMTGRN
ncbi:putative Gut-specific cysteine proteinase [Hypsibius exemplaris]|uniref:Gut-specific cysteine proteinase n=1 Tax=Hypsibius exemplaris TaxID=2072580 RepID=A0A1W0X505_HYPEX|nr:putative Gut-specific cysteine proteinase [Hypsibius exemplaris]